MTLDAKTMFKQVNDEKLPFFKWNQWLQTHIEKIQFETMYTKKQEVKIKKMLKDVQVEDRYF